MDRQHISYSAVHSLSVRALSYDGPSGSVANTVIVAQGLSA